MKSCTVAGVAMMVFAALPFSDIARAQEQQSPSSPPDPAGLLKKSADPARQLADLLKEAQNPGRKAEAQPENAFFQPKYADVAKFAKKLPCLLEEGCVVEIVEVDTATNSIVIRANAKNTRKVKEVLDRFDEVARFQDYVLPGMLVIPLEHANAAKTAKELKAMLGDHANCVATDERANSILITGSEAKMRQAKEILRRLDVKDK